MSRLFVASIFLSASFTFTVHLAAQETTPPKTGQEIVPSHQVVAGSTTPVKVVLLTSWGVTTGWEDLKTQWPNYGSAPLVIDDSTYIGSGFTYADLVNSNADVIVLSDPGGGGRQYSSTEIAAVARYASEGHTVLGTYVVFEWTASNVDNRGLMPVFGLNPSLSYDNASISNTFAQVADETCLLRNISSPWQSTGYPFSQVPTSAQKWTHNALNLAFPIAASDSDTGIVSVFNGGRYAGIYISNYPEYYGGTQDLQLLYNAVTCFAQKGK
jgi:hypothetical protein